MIEVKEIQLDITLPDDGIGMVIMQPFVELDTHHEPYRWIEDKRNKQIERIIRTLEIAKQEGHGCEKSHFVIFPEYSIPGLEGIQKIYEILSGSSWEKGTIVIGGVDGLTKSEYSTLCGENNTQVHQENKPEKVRDDQWVNCCITWVKQINGSLKRWVQPKLVPATQEELCPANHMFEGRAVYVFRPKIAIQDSELPFRFLSFICKDWIGNSGGSNVVDLVLSQLERDRSINNDRLDIYLCFILKRNPQPDYPLFLQRTSQYINEESFPSIRRSDGAVLFVNNAGKEGPGYCSEFGKSGFVFHPNCSFISDNEYCPPTYTLKKRDVLATCKEARFREDGACIISFKFIPPIPSIVRRSPATPKIPMNPAIVYSIDAIARGVERDHRTPGAEVPASVKWVNDQLDNIKPILHYQNNSPLREEIEQKHEEVSEEIRKLDDTFSCKSLEQAVYNYDKWINLGGRKIANVDNWDEREKLSLETVVYSLSVIKACKSLKISGSISHATIRNGNNILDVIIVSGGETHKKCFEYGTRFLISEQRFGIIITRDIHDTLVNERDKSIIETEGEITERGPNITCPSSRFIHCGYSNLKNVCFDSNDLTDLCNKMTEIIDV